MKTVVKFIDYVSEKNLHELVGENVPIPSAGEKITLAIDEYETVYGKVHHIGWLYSREMVTVYVFIAN